MNILAFDTCFDACSVCVAETREASRRSRAMDRLELASARERFETGHAERLLPMIDEVMAKAGVAFDDLNRIAVTVGPGTFTGTRIGVAAARALVLTTGLGVVGVSSLAVMADMAADELAAAADEDLAVAVDARRGEVYVQLFAPSGLTQKSQPMLLSIEDAARLGGEGPLLVVGSGGAGRRGRRQHARAGASRRSCRTSCPMRRRWRRSRPIYAPAEAPLAPLYLRAPDAKPQDGKSIARAAPMRYPAGPPFDLKNLSLLWASPELVPDIAVLHGRLFDPPWDVESISRLTEHPAAAAFVAQVQYPKTLAGFIIGQIAADEAEILSIGVAPEWQRRGIARHMVEGLVRAARRAEVKRLFLEVAADNAKAIRLYKGLGLRSRRAPQGLLPPARHARRSMRSCCRLRSMAPRPPPSASRRWTVHQRAI